jgi:transcriptional regulator with XRE-family HTH domain
METSFPKNTRKSSGTQNVNGVAIRTLSVNEAIADALRPWSPKAIAKRVRTSVRTVENWKNGRTGPQAKHVAAILNDAELGPAFLTAVGRADLATRAELASLQQRVKALKADEARHEREAHEIRSSLEGDGRSVSTNRGASEHEGDAVAAAGRVVPESSD